MFELPAASTIDSVSFDVFLLPDMPSKVSASADVKRKVAINVYGSVDAAAEVGGHLSKGKLYLQQRCTIQQRSYENPHYFKSTFQQTPPWSQSLCPRIENWRMRLFTLDSLSGGPNSTQMGTATEWDEVEEATRVLRE